MKIENKIVVVTGGAGGIGQALGKSFIYENAKVVILLDINFDNIESTNKSLITNGLIFLIVVPLFGFKLLISLVGNILLLIFLVPLLIHVCLGSASRDFLKIELTLERELDI